MIAGGASFAPRRWSWPMFATEARSSPWWRFTAWITAAQKNMKLTLSAGVSPGSSRLCPVSVPIDQLLCLPEPLTPAKGFSCSRQTRPYLRATRSMTCIVSCWWSEPTFEFSKIGASSYWPGRDLVVTCLDRHAELRELVLEVHDAGEHTLRDRPEVVVVQLMALGRVRAEQRAPGQNQVGAGVEVLLVDQEVLLLWADGGEDPLGLLVAEQLQRADRRLREGVHRAQQRDLGVERLTGPRDERRRDAEQRAVRVLDEERRASRVPRGVAAGLERVADAARRERRGVGLALDQLLAAEPGEPVALAVGLEERIVLLRGEARQGLEDMGVVGGSPGERPLLHRFGD